MDGEEATEDVTRAAVAAAIERAIADGRSAEGIGKAIGKSRQMMQLYRDRVHSMSFDTAVLLARELGINLTELAGVERIPDRSRELSGELRQAAETQADLASALSEIARDVERLAGPAPGASGTG